MPSSAPSHPRVTFWPPENMKTISFLFISIINFFYRNQKLPRFLLWKLLEGSINFWVLPNLFIISLAVSYPIGWTGMFGTEIPIGWKGLFGSSKVGGIKSSFLILWTFLPNDGQPGVWGSPGTIKTESLMIPVSGSHHLPLWCDIYIFFLLSFPHNKKEIY